MIDDDSPARKESDSERLKMDVDLEDALRGFIARVAGTVHSPRARGTYRPCGRDSAQSSRAWDIGRRMRPSVVATHAEYLHFDDGR